MILFLLIVEDPLVLDELVPSRTLMSFCFHLIVDAVDTPQHGLADEPDIASTSKEDAEATACPICGIPARMTDMNAHVDLCLLANEKREALRRAPYAQRMILRNS